MAAGIFVIEEVRSGGLQGERFEWTADRRAPGPAGGAAAAPKGPWSAPLHQAIVRTDYGGARKPSYQMLGPRRQPSTITGYWDDRYNFPGYAVQEMRRMEDVVSRGNMCRISYQGQIFEAVITELDPEYRGSWRIEYTITFDVSGRPDEFSANRSPQGPLTPAQRFDDIALSVAAMQEAQLRTPAGVLKGSLADRMADDMAKVTLDKNKLGGILDQRSLKPGIIPSASLPRLATQMRVLAESSRAVVSELVAVRSDVDCAYQTAKATMDFESWGRDLRYFGRLVAGRAESGARDMDERASPRAERLYKPREGEHLYAISRKFYNTPLAWRLISERNQLRAMTMTGEEVLIIPERGTG